MATNTTFTSLKNDIANYIERGGSLETDATVYEQIPRFINMAERILIEDLKLLGTLEVLSNAPVGLSEGVSVYAKPDRWRQTVSMNYGTGTYKNKRVFLLPRSYEYVRTYWPDSTLMGSPRWYTDYDYSHWLVAPTPDDTYPWEILCYMQPPLLDDVNQTNFWTDYTPAALLFGSLLQATPFLGEDSRIPVWASAYQKEVEALVNQDLQRQIDRAAIRTRV